MCFEEQFGTITAADIKEEKSYLLVSLSTYITFRKSMVGEKCGLAVTEEQLQEVAELSNVLEGTDDFLSNSFRQECKRHIENVDDVKPSEAAMAYLYLKANIDLSRVCTSD